MTYTKPTLRKKIISQVRASSKGGKPGQWSARKAQLVAKKYKDAGGGYTGKKQESQKSLSKWTKEKWRTKSGKPSTQGPKATGERSQKGMIQDQTVSKPESADNSERKAGSSAPPCSALVMFSSGITSWAAAKRYAETHGTDGMVLLFADTGIEDEDNYRFLHEAAENIGAPLEIIADGRTPWEVFNDVRMIGNNRFDPCSRVLKRELLDKWRNENCTYETDIIVGILWDEVHRIERLKERCAPWNYIAPLCDKPLISKRDCLSWARREGIEPPRMYEMGFPHANCGGFCVKAGQATFRLLLKNFPERYAEHERQEAELMEKLGGKWGVLRDRRGGEAKPITLKEFRKRVEADESAYDEFDFGGCACALNI